MVRKFRLDCQAEFSELLKTDSLIFLAKEANLNGGLVAALLTHRRRGPGSIPGGDRFCEKSPTSRKNGRLRESNQRSTDQKSRELPLSWLVNVDGETVSLIFLVFCQNRQPNFLMSKFS